jgi:hypothetical protein
LILHFSSLPRYTHPAAIELTTMHAYIYIYIYNNKDLNEFRIQGALLKGKLNFERLAKLW